MRSAADNHYYEQVYRGQGWQKKRLAVLRRDGHRCQFLGCKTRSPDLTVHHKKPYRCFKSGDERANRLSNLISLCWYHHQQEEAKVLHLRTHAEFKPGKCPDGFHGRMRAEKAERKRRQVLADSQALESKSRVEDKLIGNEPLLDSNNYGHSYQISATGRGFWDQLASHAIVFVFLAGAICGLKAVEPGLRALIQLICNI